ncbi:MAG: preprotein translocase subunit YajC [Ruminococcus sp.]|nr:preprotein translocase subunit YajC [Ruminococcus sp.]
MKRKIASIIASAVSAATALSYGAMNAFAEEAASGGADSGNKAANPLFTLVIPLVGMFAILYFMAIRPQKKKEQEMKDMQNSLQVGDEIVTTGGIIGMIVRVGEDNVVIETGGERNKLRLKNWAIAENISAIERAKAASPKKNASPLASAGLVDETEGKKSKKKKKNDTEE